MDKLTAALIILTLALAVFATGTHVASLVLPITIASAAMAIIVFPGAVLASPKFFRWQQLPLDKTAVVIFAILLALFGIIAPKLLINQPDGIYTGIINAYGDIAWHMANITSFAEGQSLPPENPIFADNRLTYPFMTNFFSAALLSLGISTAASVNFVAALMIPVLLSLLYALVKELTNNKAAAVIALLLFLFGGATFGFLRFIPDWHASNLSLFEFLAHLPDQDYSGVGTDAVFHFLNPVTTLLLPQRSFLFAFPIVFSMLLLLLPRREPTKYHFLAAGTLAGTLPLFHAHSVLAITPVIAGMFVLSVLRRREGVGAWLWFAIPALIIGIAEVLYYLTGISEGESFLRWGPRWMAGDTNVVWYWFLNTGLLIPTLIIGLFLKVSREIKLLALVGFGIFVAANLFLFAPWAWDNFKLFVWFFVFALPLVSLVAAKLVIGNWSLVIKSAAVALLTVHMLSAGLDIFKLSLPTSKQWSEWDTNGIAFAQQIKQITKPGDSILTAPNHNSPVVLSGRPRYLGYAAHVWSHGLDPWGREAAIEQFYAGKINTLPESQPDYILVGPHERLDYPDLVIQPTWQLVAENANHQLFKLP